VAQELARIGAEELRGRVVLHTSGALDERVLDHGEGLRRGGRIDASVAVFQRCCSAVLEGQSNLPVEVIRQAVRVARQIARSLGGAPVRIPNGKKVLYHAAATMAASHVLAVKRRHNNC